MRKEKHHDLELGWTKEERESINSLRGIPNGRSGSRMVQAVAIG